MQIAKVDIKKDLDTGRVDLNTLNQGRKQELLYYYVRMYTWDHNGQKVPGLEDLAKAMKKGDSPNSPQQQRARNCAYIFLGGQRVGVYDKHSDFVETCGAPPDKLSFLPGTTEQAPEVDGLRFGVEICFDHANGLLKKRGLSDLDFHVVVSDSVKTVEANMAMKRSGYFLHASTNPSQTMVVFRPPNQKLTPLNLSPAAGQGILSFCKIDSPPK